MASQDQEKELQMLQDEILHAHRNRDFQKAVELNAVLRDKLNKKKNKNFDDDGDQEDDDIVQHMLKTYRKRKRRVVVTDLVEFENVWVVRKLDEEDLENAIFILSEKYSSVVHGVQKEPRLWRRNCSLPSVGPAILKLEDGENLQSYLLHKHKQGQIFWIGQGKGKTLKDLSTWLGKMKDPCTGNKYHELKLQLFWWKKRFPSPTNLAKYTKSGTKVAQLIQSNSTEHKSLLELLYQSNPNLLTLI